MGVDLPTLRAKLFRLLMGTKDSVAAGPTKRQDQVEEIGGDPLDSSGEFEVVVVPDNFLSSASGPVALLLLLLLLVVALVALLPFRRLSLMSELNFEAKIATLLGGMAIETLKPGTTFLWNDDDNEGRRRTLRGRCAVIKPALPLPLPPPPDKLLAKDGADTEEDAAVLLVFLVAAVVMVEVVASATISGLWQRR